MEESENIARDHFSPQQGWSAHALRTKKGEDQLSTIGRIDRDVHDAHTQNKKLGAVGINDIKKDHKRDSEQGEFPPVNDGASVRPALWRALEENRDVIMKSRKRLIDEVKFVRNPYQSEVNEILGVFKRLNTQNATHVPDLAVILTWMGKEKIAEKFPDRLKIVEYQVDAALCAIRKKGKKSTPTDRRWAEENKDSLRLLIRLQALQPILDTPPEEAMEVVDQLIEACKFEIGQELFQKCLNGVLMCRVERTIDKCVEVWASGNDMTAETMDDAQLQCRDKVEEVIGGQKVPKERPVPLSHSLRFFCLVFLV